jgi:hypothetical protein
MPEEAFGAKEKARPEATPYVSISFNLFSYYSMLQGY